jgi:hypothetical protein
MFFYGSSIVGSGDYIGLYVFVDYSVDVFLSFLFTCVMSQILCSVCWMYVVCLFWVCNSVELSWVELSWIELSWVCNTKCNSYSVMTLSLGGSLHVLHIKCNGYTTVGSSHKVVWQPRTRWWTRHTDNVAGSVTPIPRKKLRASGAIASVTCIPSPLCFQRTTSA